MGLSTLDKGRTARIENLFLNMGIWGAKQIKNQPISRLRHTAIQTGKNIVVPYGRIIAVGQIECARKQAEIHNARRPIASRKYIRLMRKFLTAGRNHCAVYVYPPVFNVPKV